MKKVNYFFYLTFNWLVIIGCLFLVKWHWAFFPLSFLIISNRQFANYLVGHDAVHGLISQNKFINDFLGRVFCLGPVFVSLQSYREKHLSHHEFLGTPIDPDKRLYDFYPAKAGEYLKNLTVYFFSMQMTRDFLIYFTPVFEFNKKQFYRREKVSDFVWHVVIALVFSIAFIAFFGWQFFLLLWIGPLIALMPYYYFVSALQHGLIHEKEGTDNSRNIEGNWVLMEFLLPCATNFHGVHHQYPQVPFYHLGRVYRQKKLPGTSYQSAFRSLIHSS